MRQSPVDVLVYFYFLEIVNKVQYIFRKYNTNWKMYSASLKSTIQLEKKRKKYSASLKSTIQFEKKSVQCKFKKYNTMQYNKVLMFGNFGLA